MPGDRSRSRPFALVWWRRVRRLPGGRRLFTAAVARRAPYFRSVPVLVCEVRPGLVRAVLRDRRRVRNHLGTVHAIAVANLLELAMGVCAEVSIPADLRWIPQGMTLEYVGKGATDLTGSAEVDADAWRPGPVEVRVRAVDAAGADVVRGTITLWVSPRPDRRSADPGTTARLGRSHRILTRRS